MCLKACIVKKINSAIIAEFGSLLISINRSHYIGSEDMYSIGKDVVVCVICVDPSSKQINGSMLPHLMHVTPLVSKIPKLCTAANIGSRFSNAEIERVDKRTVHVNLPQTNGLKAVIKKAHITTKMDGPNLKSKFNVGSQLTCRIIDYDFFENVALATMKKKLLKLPYLSVTELKLGDRVNVVVKRCTKFGMVVRVEDRLTGLIPYLHLSDVIIKQPHEKFKPGDKLLSRVLHIDERVDKLLLTAKPSLVNAKYPLLGSPNMFHFFGKKRNQQPIVVGFVFKVTQRGLLIAGVNEVRGWLPQSETGLSHDDIMHTNYYEGQVLHMKLLREFKKKSTDRVATIDSTQKHVKYLLSLKINLPLDLNSISVNLDQHNLQKFEIGQLFDAVVKKSTDKSVIVNLFTPGQSNQTYANEDVVGVGYLSNEQLSDFETNERLLSYHIRKPDTQLNWLAPIYRDGETDVEESSRGHVVLVGKTDTTLVVSAKPSFIRAVQEVPSDISDVSYRTGFVRSFDDLRVGSQWFAWIIKHADYGIFVQFPCGIHGLAPKRLLSETHIPANVRLLDLYPIGSTVIAKIVEVSAAEKRRCLVSLRLVDTYFAKEHYVTTAIECLNDWLTERQWILERIPSLNAFRIGDQVQFRVQTIDNLIVLGSACKMSTSKSPNWIDAIALVANTENVRCIEDQTYPGIVSLVDVESNRLEVILSTWIVNSVANRKENRLSELRSGQQVQSVVVAYRNRDMAVVALRGHASGRFGVVPTRRTFNDIAGVNAWSIGQRNKVTFRQPFEQRGRTDTNALELCTLSIYDPIDSDDSAAANKRVKRKAAFVKFKPGQMLNNLYFYKLSNRTVFFKPNRHSDQLVFCHVIQWDTSSKHIRTLLHHPPDVDSVLADDKVATVMNTPDQNKYLSRRGRRSGVLLGGNLTEVSFLSDPHVGVGKLFCAELRSIVSDYWRVRLPSENQGRLHITSIDHNLKLKALNLNEHLTEIPNVKRHFDQLMPRAFVTCRIIDQMEMVRQSNYLTSNSKLKRSNSVIYFVSTKNQSIRNANLIEKPALGSHVGAIVKLNTADGLVLSFTHSIDILVPFDDEIQSRLSQVSLKFKTGDYLLVCPYTLLQDRMIGYLVFDDSQLNRKIEDVTCLVKYVKTLLTGLKSTRGEQRSTKRPSSDVATESRSTEIPKKKSKKSPLKRSHIECIGESDDETKKVKMFMTDEHIQLDDDYQSHCADDTANMCDQSLLIKYQQFMPPKNSSDDVVEGDDRPIDDPCQNKSSADTTKGDVVDVSTSEWRLRDSELRQAMLSALTAEQQSFAKSSLRPQSSHEFELAVRNAPSKAAYWTAYMTFILSSCAGSSIDEVRSIADRGMKAILNAAEDGQKSVELGRLLLFTFIMEAKQLERVHDRLKQPLPSNSLIDPVLMVNDQSDRVTRLLQQLVQLDQIQLNKKAVDILSDIGQHERAQETARRLVKSNPTDVDRWLCLVRARFRAGNTLSAREAQRNAGVILKSSQLSQLTLGLARIEFDLGDVDRGISLLKEQLKVTNKSKQVYEECIRLLMMNDKLNEAKLICDQAHQNLKPNELRMVDNLFKKSTTDI